MSKPKVIKAQISVTINIPEDWDTKEDNSNPRLERICEEIRKSKDVIQCSYSFYNTTK